MIRAELNSETGAITIVSGTERVPFLALLEGLDPTHVAASMVSVSVAVVEIYSDTTGEEFLMGVVNELREMRSESEGLEVQG